MIPRRLIQSVPQNTSATQDKLWAIARDLHPGWDHVSYRDPVDPAQFPRTSPHWEACTSGAQRAGLIRLEALWNDGGIWLDSDMHIHRSLEPLLQCQAFAGWEEPTIVPDAVIGAAEGHFAIDACIRLALARLTGTSGEPLSFATDTGAWSTGPGVTTTVLPDRDDVLLFGPDAFYPVFYVPRETLAQRLADHQPAPWTFGTHRWDWSWR